MKNGPENGPQARTEPPLIEITYDDVWSTASDVWVLLRPDSNPWTEEIDWSLGLLLRRSVLRDERRKALAKSDFLLLGGPEGLPAQRVLVLSSSDLNVETWLQSLGPILTAMKVSNATIFSPDGWNAPSVRQVTSVAHGHWGLRWVAPIQ